MHGLVLFAEVTKGIPDKKLDEQIPESGPAISNIARSINNFQVMSQNLGLTGAEQQEILGNNPHSVAAQKMGMLRQWRQKNFYGGATYRKLMELLYSAGDNNAVEAVRKELSK